MLQRDTTIQEHTFYGWLLFSSLLGAARLSCGWGSVGLGLLILRDCLGLAYAAAETANHCQCGFCVLLLRVHSCLAGYITSSSRPLQLLIKTLTETNMSRWAFLNELVTGLLPTCVKADVLTALRARITSRRDCLPHSFRTEGNRGQRRLAGSQTPRLTELSWLKDGGIAADCKATQTID